MPKSNHSPTSPTNTNLDLNEAFIQTPNWYEQRLPPQRTRYKSPTVSAKLLRLAVPASGRMRPKPPPVNTFLSNQAAAISVVPRHDPIQAASVQHNLGYMHNRSRFEVPQVTYPEELTKPTSLIKSPRLTRRRTLTRPLPPIGETYVMAGNRSIQPIDMEMNELLADAISDSPIVANLRKALHTPGEHIEPSGGLSVKLHPDPLTEESSISR